MHRPSPHVGAAALKCAFMMVLGAAPHALHAQTDTLSLEQRIVAASRIHTAVQANFAHWDGIPSVDFDSLFRQYAGRIAATSSRRAFDLESMALLAALSNGHTWYGDWWLRRRDGQALGFYAHPVDGRWIVTESQLGELTVGDAIERIDGMPIDSVYRENRRYLFASDERWRQRTLFEQPYLFPASFTLTLEGGRQVKISRAGPFVFHGDGWTSDSVYVRDGLLVIRIPSFAKPVFEDSAIAAIRRAAAGTGELPRAIVLDLRGNHGGNVPLGLIRAVMVSPYRNWTQATPATVSMFRSWGVLGQHASLEWSSEPLVPSKSLYQGPLFVLVDDGCYSACEDVVMPLQTSHRATVVGARTAGSSGQTFTLDLGDGMAIGVSYTRYRLPDGSAFEGVGLAPDIAAPTHIEDIRRHRDPALEAVVQNLRRPTGERQ